MTEYSWFNKLSSINSICEIMWINNTKMNFHYGYVEALTMENSFWDDSKAEM